jgi:hypothetical protein
MLWLGISPQIQVQGGFVCKQSNLVDFKLHANALYVLWSELLITNYQRNL